MVGILLDETGDISLDEYNNTIEVDNNHAFRQIITNLFHTIPGSEILHSTYGFPLEQAIRESGVEESEMFIEMLVVQALDPRIEKTIKNLDYVKAEKRGRDMHVNIRVSSVLDDTITTDINLAETFGV